MARAHPGGIADLSVGTPVDPTPERVRAALRAAADAPGYPFTAGAPGLRAAIQGWLSRRLDVPAGVAVVPTVGSKELVALLPWLLGVRGGVAFPDLAYPTYEVGARLAGCAPVPWPSTAPGRVSEAVSLLWVNSPANPTGAVLGADVLAAILTWARAAGVLVVSDECYLEFGWDAEPVSVLHPSICGDNHEGLLAVHSLSKRSNMAGYRAGFVAGDPNAVARLLELRKHAGLIVPGPVQAAMIAALDDDEHVAEQRERYRRRRAVLMPALAAAGFRIEASAAGLYLWCTRGEECWASVRWLAERGILVAPGEFYGPAGACHVRVALTATDERVGAAAERLTGTSGRSSVR